MASGDLPDIGDIMPKLEDMPETMDQEEANKMRADAKIREWHMHCRSLLRVALKNFEHANDRNGGKSIAILGLEGYCRVRRDLKAMLKEEGSLYHLKTIQLDHRTDHIVTLYRPITSRN